MSESAVTDGPLAQAAAHTAAPAERVRIARRPRRPMQAASARSCGT